MARMNVLIVCTGNSARSQMAEGLLRHMAGDLLEVHSAGMEPKGINPLAIAAMAELGIDISHHRSKSVREFMGQMLVHQLIIVCDHAYGSCPRIFPGMIQRHFWPFEDPAVAEGTEADRLARFREVRDQIAQKLRQWVEDIRSGKATVSLAERLDREQH